MKTKTDKNSINWVNINNNIQFQLFIFYKPSCLQKKIHMGIFLRQELHVWVDTVSPQINTIASHDQFKPV